MDWKLTAFGLAMFMAGAAHETWRSDHQGSGIKAAIALIIFVASLFL